MTPFGLLYFYYCCICFLTYFALPFFSLRANKVGDFWMTEYFQNKLVDTIHFMEILNLKDSVEKDTFFRKLPNLAEQLPRQIVLKKVWF